DDRTRRVGVFERANDLGGHLRIEGVASLGSVEADPHRRTFHFDEDAVHAPFYRSAPSRRRKFWPRMSAVSSSPRPNRRMDAISAPGSAIGQSEPKTMRWAPCRPMMERIRSGASAARLGGHDVSRETFSPSNSSSAAASWW